MTGVKDIKLLREDILIKKHPLKNMLSSIIDVISDDEQKEKLNWFEVLSVSENVTEVVVGDVILLEYLKHTIPVELDGEMCAITEQQYIVGVLEDD